MRACVRENETGIRAVCGAGGVEILAQRGSHFPSRLTHSSYTHTNGKRWNIITVRAAVRRPLTQAALCSNADTHTRTRTHTRGADPDSGLPYRQYNYSYYI